MKDYDYHSLFYYGVLVPLQNLRDEGGRLFKATAPKTTNIPEFTLAYPIRARSYNHNYEREAFMADRDKLIVASISGRDSVVLLKTHRFEDTAVLYKKALRYLFKSDSMVAKRELLLMLDKFYQVTVENAYEVDRVDFSSDIRQANNGAVNNFVRLPRETPANDGLVGRIFTRYSANIAPPVDQFEEYTRIIHNIE